MGHKVAITEALQIAQEGGHASVNHHLIQHNLLVQVGVVVCRARRHIYIWKHERDENNLDLCSEQCMKDALPACPEHWHIGVQQVGVVLCLC